MNSQLLKQFIAIFKHSKVLSNDVSDIFDKHEMNFLRNISNFQTSFIMKMGKEGKEESGKSGSKYVGRSQVK